MGSVEYRSRESEFSITLRCMALAGLNTILESDALLTPAF
jgi:hypothetical protein